MEKVFVLIVDDHPMIVEGMKSMLANINFVEIACTAHNAFEAMEKLKAHHIDIAFIDINMPEVSGLELTLKIKKEFPAVKVLAMSTFKERSYISQMIQNGASGYLLKSASREEIEDAICCMRDGKQYLSTDISSVDLENDFISKIPVISRREKEVLQLIADGLTNPQIAEKLFISLNTADSHRKNLLTKFKVNNTASLIKIAVKLNLV